jgi:titin
VAAINSIGEGVRSSTANATPGTVPTAPQGLAANPANAKIRLNWTGPIYNGGCPVTNYTVYRDGIYVTTIGNVTVFTDSGLTNGMVYHYRVSATNLIGEGLQSNDVQSVPRTVPGAPQDLKVTYVKVQATLTWKPPASDGGAPILSYRIYRGTSPGMEYLHVDAFTLGTSWTDKNITIGRSYYYTVSAVNVAGEGLQSNEQMVTPYDVPHAPILISLAGISKISLSWTTPGSNGAMINHYRIFRGTAPGGETKLIDVSSNGTTWVDSNVTVAITYYYTVCAVNIAGEGKRSNEINATPFAVPDAPTLTVTSGIKKVDLSWAEPASNGAPILDYKIYRGISSNTENLIADTYTNGTTWSDGTVTAGTIYFYFVCAFNAAGEGPRSVEQKAIPYSVPDSPTLTATAGVSKVTLTWNTPGSNGAIIEKYMVYRGRSAGGEGLFIKDVKTTTWVDTDVTVATTYFYVVSAVNAAGEGPLSMEQSSIPFNVPGAPGLNITNGVSEVSLTWTIPSANGAPIIKYNIYRGMFLGEEHLYVDGYIGGTSFVNRNIKNDSTYYYRVSAINAAGEGPRSNEQMGGEIPVVPTGLAATPGNGKVALKWSTPSAGGVPTRYNIYRSDSQLGTYVLIASTTTTNYNDLKVNNGHEYWYEINAQNAVSVSGNTTAISTTPNIPQNAWLGGTSFIILILVVIIISSIIAIAIMYIRKKKKT